MPRIYLSPSLQEFNLYTGGGNEEAYMNLIADAVIPYLQASGIAYTRNNPSNTLAEAIAESNRGSYGMHVALHSNASPDSMAGQLRGVDVYYRPHNPQSLRFAQIVAENFRKIYPDPSRVDVRPTDTLAEVIRTHSPAVLIEVAYHDNVDDANWIKSHIEEIARTVVLSLTEYFGIPFLNPQPIKVGTVATGVANLNLRSMPSTKSIIVALLPNGSKVTIYGKTGEWYVVKYKNATGYANARYIAVD